MSESPAGAPDPGSDPAGDAPPREADPPPALARSRESSFNASASSNKLMRSASLRRTPLARFASVGRKAGSIRLNMSQSLSKTRATTDYRRDILSKPSEERTESDLLSLMEILGRLRFAESLRHAEKVEVCKSMGYRSKRKGAVVFNQGDPGNIFYIVLSGSVSVSVRASESDAEVQVATLYNGDSFGELALLREGSVRSATVRAETDVEFLVISRGDYNRILGAVTEEQLAEKIKFLHALPAFAGVPASMLRSAAYVLSTREYTRNAVVFKQGEETEEIFFVERGGVKFVREVRDARALARMGVHRDGPAAAARVAAGEKGGFDAVPPPPPGVDDAEEEMMDAFSHLEHTARRGPGSSVSSRPRTPTTTSGDIFVSDARRARGGADEARAPAEAANSARGAVSRETDENENATKTPSSVTGGPATVASFETPPFETEGAGDAAGFSHAADSAARASPPDAFPSPSKTRSSFGGSTLAASGNASRRASRGAPAAAASARRRGVGRLFLEAGRVGAMDYFGDVVLTSKVPQPASAVTTEPTRVFVLNKWDMLKRVDRDVARRFRLNKAKSMAFLGDDDAVLAEFKRAMVWDRYRNSLVEEVVQGKRGGKR